MHSSHRRPQDWLATQKAAALKQSERHRLDMVAARERTRTAEVAEAAREEAARAELLAREAELPPDVLGADYFQDKARFNKEQDERDPIHEGRPDNGEAGDWRTFVGEGVSRAREVREQVAQARPFEAMQMEASHGEIGYRVIRFAKGIVASISLLILVLLFLEVKWQYDEQLDYFYNEEAAYRKTKKTS